MPDAQLAPLRLVAICIKIEEFCILKLRSFALELMDFAFKMMALH